MSKYLACFKCFRKKIDRNKYINEIFDSLDLDGTQRLEANELGIIWNIYAAQQIERLHDEIKNIEQQDAKQLLHLYSNGKPFTSKTFFYIIKMLKIPDAELVELWKGVKSQEISVIKNQLDGVVEVTLATL